MSSFSRGEKVTRISAVSVELHHKTGIRKGEVYTVSGTKPLRLVESLDPTFSFNDDAFVSTLGTSDWSPNRADVLRQSAEAAIANYNQYIKGQPKMYEPMDIK